MYREMALRASLSRSSCCNQPALNIANYKTKTRLCLVSSIKIAHRSWRTSGKKHFTNTPTPIENTAYSGVQKPHISTIRSTIWIIYNKSLCATSSQLHSIVIPDRSGGGKQLLFGELEESTCLVLFSENYFQSSKTQIQKKDKNIKCSLELFF